MRKRIRTPVLLGVGITAAIGLFAVLRPENERDAAGTATPATASDRTATGITTAPASTRRGRPAVTTIRISIRRGRVIGGVQRATVARNRRVILHVGADIEDGVHVHGYDLTRAVAPRRPARLAFRATIPGRFDVELEQRHLPIAELEVRP